MKLFLTMSSRGYWSSYSLRSVAEVIFSNRYGFSAASHGHSSGWKMAKIGPGYSMHKGLQLISTDSGKWRGMHTNMMKQDPVGPPTPRSPKFNFQYWARWALGCILSFFPFWNQKWEQLKRIEGEAEMIVGGVESVAGVVEKAATAVEKASADAAEKLPENGKLRETAMLIERVSKATAHDAHLTKEFLHKVDELKQDFDDLENMVEPVVEKFACKKP